MRSEIRTEREGETGEGSLSGDSEFESNGIESFSLCAAGLFMLRYIFMVIIESEYLGTTGSTWLSVEDRTRVLDILSECLCLLSPSVAVR